MLGKHSKEGQKIVQLEAIIKRKDQEIKDIRQGCADAFKLIYDLSKSNGYGETRVIMNKMGEIAKDNFNLLLIISPSLYLITKITVFFSNFRKSLMSII